MAGTVEDAGYWLPSEFFDDALTDKPENQTVDSDSGFPFPTEFPYQIERFKDKRRVMSTSSQLSFSGRFGGSPNGVVPPPNDAVGDLIYLAAGQFAKLKLNSGNAPRPDNKSGLTGPAIRPDQLYPAAAKPNPSAFHNIYLEEQVARQRKQACGMRYGEPQVHPGWPVLQSPARIGRPGGGSAGTGVFLPRRYDNIKNDSNNICSSGYAPAYIPQRNLHALSQPNFNPEYEMLMARRNALMLQHKRSLLLKGWYRLNRGVCLPRDWTY